MVNTYSNCNFSITGTAVIPESSPIQLFPGWSLISYLRNNPIDVVTAMSSISNSIILIKDNYGNIYYPGYGINNIGNMQVGQGYWIYMNAPAVLIYPEN